MDLRAAPVRDLTPADLAACVALGIDRDWPPEPVKWGFLLSVGRGFGVDAPGGGLAAAVVLTRFEPGVATVSMMLVASRFGGRGLGTRLVRHALAEAGEAVVFLYATRIGRPLYAKLGFRVLVEATTRAGSFAAEPGVAGRTRRAGPADLAAIKRLDARAYGADRSAVVDRLPGFAEQVRVLERGGEPTGYGVAWHNGRQRVIGPVVAADGADARALVTDLACGAECPVRLDLDHSRPDLVEWAAARGLRPRFDATIMVHDGATLPGDRDRLFLPFMQSVG